tara:strand:- start:33 stop:215 length:183 start_codon:yes stop_codon:yes gene_type:complete
VIASFPSLLFLPGQLVQTDVVNLTHVLAMFDIPPADNDDDRRRDDFQIQPQAKVIDIPVV